MKRVWTHWLGMPRRLVGKVLPIYRTGGVTRPILMQAVINRPSMVWYIDLLTEFRGKKGLANSAYFEDWRWLLVTNQQVSGDGKRFKIEGIAVRSRSEIVEAMVEMQESA